MEIFGNMQVLSFLSRVMISLRYQNGYCACGGGQQYYYGIFAVHKLPFVAPKFRLPLKKAYIQHNHTLDPVAKQTV